VTALAASALAAIGALLAVGAVVAGGTSPAIERIAVQDGPSGRRPLLRLLEGLGGSRLGRRVGRTRVAELRRSADAGWTVEQIAGAKLLVPAVVVATGIAAPFPGRVLVVPIAFVAWRVPELVLARAARRRLARASAEMPLFLDLLAVATSAGLAPQLAVRIAAEPLDGPLADELRSAIARTELGRRWRDEIAAAAERLGLADLRRATAVLGRSESLGSSLADEISRLAADVRETRRSRAAERARTAPVKMLFPLVFLILPAFLLLTVVPVLLSTVRSIG
jgi:pilus assembly protein TadC